MWFPAAREDYSVAFAYFRDKQLLPRLKSYRDAAVMPPEVPMVTDTILKTCSFCWAVIVELIVTDRNKISLADKLAADLASCDDYRAVAEKLQNYYDRNRGLISSKFMDEGARLSPGELEKTIVAMAELLEGMGQNLAALGYPVLRAAVISARQERELAGRGAGA